MLSGAEDAFTLGTPLFLPSDDCQLHPDLLTFKMMSESLILRFANRPECERNFI